MLKATVTPAALAHALPRLRMLDLCQCAIFAHNAGAGHVRQDLNLLLHLQLLVAGCDNVVKCVTEECQMSRLGQLKHLSWLIPSINARTAAWAQPWLP